MLCCKCGLSISFVEPMYSTEPCHRCITRAELPTPTADVAALTPAPQPAEGAWQPIETAPMRSIIDIWIEGMGEDGWRITGKIVRPEPHAIELEDGTIYYPHENGGFPTHWMPLPTPPTAAIRGGAE